MQHRQCVVLIGSLRWCKIQAAALVADKYANVLNLSGNSNLVKAARNQASSQLGKEYDAIIFDGHGCFHVNSFGIVTGAIKSGGVLILLLPESTLDSLFRQWFQRVITDFARQHQSFHIIKAGDSLPKLTLKTPDTLQDKHYCTDDQKQAIDAILRVVYGHRRRPLVIVADRGRGKSAALGIAAAQLLNKGKQKIIVTAPRLAVLDSLFDHARRQLEGANVSAGLINFNNSTIKFIAPDKLIRSEAAADIVMVDEAAALPATILAQLLTRYARLVFATTLHGYEGTGGGFAIRFQPILDANTPGWHYLNMTTPIRWQAGDMLEKFSFDALLLDAEPVDDKLIADAPLSECKFIHCNRQQLINDKAQLTSLFGLMRLAHYRTRPSDLQMMLDCQDINIYIVTFRHHIIASAWLVTEGNLDAKLSAAIHAGKRRLKGHILPQSLLAHAGITTAGSLSYQRIMRIVVHPALRQRKIGSSLLKYLSKQVEKNGDIIGASFSVDITILQFWLRAGFKIAKLGIHKDTITGDRAILLLKSTSQQGADILAKASQRFNEKWGYYLPTFFKQLHPDIIIAISQILPPQHLALSVWDKHDINAFSNALRGFEFSQPAINLLIDHMLRQDNFLYLTKKQQHLAVMVIQLYTWQDIKKRLGYSGKKEIITALRNVTRTLYHALPADRHSLS